MNIFDNFTKRIKTLGLLIAIDLLLVVITNVWHFSDLPTFQSPITQILNLKRFVLLLILWNSIPALIGCLLTLIVNISNSKKIKTGIVGFIIFGIGAHFLFQLLLLFNLESLNEFAGHGGIMFMIPPLIGVVFGVVGLAFASYLCLSRSNNSEEFGKTRF
ncbi:MAG: hypothetical protein KDB79_14850 [Acidobacteria bacterium]|nr:hypothetical protein [Acidobacteriota bacterium]